jgi:hypothetical protein
MWKRWRAASRIALIADHVAAALDPRDVLAEALVAIGRTERQRHFGADEAELLAEVRPGCCRVP